MQSTDAWAQMFRHNGYALLPEPLPEATVRRLREAILHDIEQAVQPVDHNDHGRPVRISQLWQRDELFREVLASDLVLDPLQALLGPNIELSLNRHNHATLRLAGEDAAGSIHRDNLQWSRGMVTVLFYLVDTNLDNGCTYVLPGSHWLQLTETDPHHIARDPRLAQTHLLEQMLPVPVARGGLLVIDGTLVHRPGENHTDQDRMSMTAGYHAVDELAAAEDPYRVLVRGQRLYEGNQPKQLNESLAIG